MRWYVLVILFATAASMAGLSTIVLKFDPFQSDRLIKLLFSCSLFVSVWGIGTLVFLGFRIDFAGSFRRGLWLAVLALGAITLSRLQLLNILNFSILLGVIAGIEWFLTLTLRKKDKESWT